MPNPINFPEHMTEEETAAFLNISRDTLNAWRYTRRGGPPWMKFGRAVRYSKADVLAWVEQQKVTPSAEAR